LNDLLQIKKQFQKIFQQDPYQFYEEIVASNDFIFDELGIINPIQFINAVENLNHPIYNFIKIF